VLPIKNAKLPFHLTLSGEARLALVKPAAMRPTRFLLFVICSLCLTACLPYPDPIPTPTDLPVETRITQARSLGTYHTLLYQIEAEAAREGWTPQRHAEAARLWLSLGDSRRAFPHLEAAAANDAPDALRDLIDLSIEFNQPQEAFAQLERLLAVVPTDRRALYQSALLLLPFDPTRAQQRLQQVTLDLQYGDSARTILGSMRETPPDALWSARAGALLATEELWPYAEWAFVYAAQTLSSAAAWAYAGLMRDAQGGDGQAYLDKALAQHAGNPQVQTALGIHRRQHGDDMGSLLALQFALTLDPLNPAIHAELGTTYQQMGDVAQAEKWLQSAYTLSGGSAEYDQALTNFRELLESGQIVPPPER
jgi:tetratricopeptide (TPR) repeat protein